MTKPETVRESFEKWATSIEVQLPINRHAMIPEIYADINTAWAFSGWHAAIAKLAEKAECGTQIQRDKGAAWQEWTGVRDESKAPHALTNFDAGFMAAASLYTHPPTDTALLEAMEEVIRISDRKHEAWDRAKALIKAHKK